eukprot:CAMPEP_0196819786 /NCGR_PEP_ID=MMETSP1362-20130617/72103_1 /TAXON_ID=163516 /ORGANISM="Leptocylindrus danicus, Strain CCMP1856" /LENGTH=497 /DNA_ID=CAMNT_0042198383 /DNA_START=90 /DNA_END=1583 /DNA_ORIENTATION=+
MANEKESNKTTPKIQTVRKSIALKLIRHAESGNNEVYSTAHQLFHWGTPDFDEKGWLKYVNDHRSADPGLSCRGSSQAEALSDYLAPNLAAEASSPVYFVISPMRRTIDTILPTIRALGNDKANLTKHSPNACEAVINGYYHEVEGCHLRDKPEPGMNQHEISSLLAPLELSGDESFVGFPKDPSQGWYANGTGAERRVDAEERASKFYLWLCEFLDSHLVEDAEDVYDAGVRTNTGRRRTVVMIGHGEFMGYVLKRIVAGFGYSVEHEGVPHRSTFVHFNTGITELEYFGVGRFLVMRSNQTPHLDLLDNSAAMKTGGGLKDGWSYIVPEDHHVLQRGIVTEHFADELDDHVYDQVEALKSLYLSNARRKLLMKESSDLTENVETEASNGGSSDEVSFVARRGLQVVGCATYEKNTGRLMDVVVRPSARRSKVGGSLVESVKTFVQKNCDGKRIVVDPLDAASRSFFENLGFRSNSADGGGETGLLEYLSSMDQGK